MANRIGENTVALSKKVYITASAAAVGKKEGEGPLKNNFDIICDDDLCGEKTWEKAESRLQKDALIRAMEKSKRSLSDLDFIFAGDLLNQCIGSTYGLRDTDTALVGVFGACSTMAESMALASVFIEASAAGLCAAVTSSHFCSAERQFRFPLEYGGQRPKTSQWTVTGAGAVILSDTDPDQMSPVVKEITFGKICDLGVKDANNMGAAMAPAAASTIENYLRDTCHSPNDFDLILTGDLGAVGSQLLYELLLRDGFDIEKRHNDCGLMIFDRQEQDVHAGGSGCGCCASVLSSYILPRMSKGEIGEVLFVATGALMSPTAVLQGESIPSVAHLLHLSARKEV